MRLLFISQYYPPEIGAASNRIGYFSQFLAKAGHEVAVLTTTPNYPEGRVYPGYQNRFTAKVENGVVVYRTRIFLSGKTNVVSRLTHYLSFILNSLFAKGKIKKPDIILASSPPLFVGLIAVIFKKLWRIPFILDIRDIWPESVASVGAVKNKRLLRAGEKLSHYIYRHATHITVTSPGIKKLLKNPSVTILPNAAELDLFRPDIRGDAVSKTWGLPGKFVVLYTGNLGLAQAPEVFLGAAQELRNEPDIVFLIVGSGVLLKKMESEAKEKALTNIIFTGVQSRSRMPEFVAASNVCIIPYKASDTFRNTYPSKMFDYMAGAKPIIINLKGEASELIEEAKCGRLTGEEDAKSLIAAIKELRDHPDTAHEMGQAGRKFVEEHYERSRVAGELLELLLRIVI